MIHRYKRRTAFRQTNKIFLIASEGKETEPLYFEAIKQKVAGRGAMICVNLVANPNHKSHPKDVLKRLSSAAIKKGTKAGDEMWIVIDRDAWPEADLNEVCQLAKDKGYFVGLSNPCFELWLFLHLKDNRSFPDRTKCQEELGKVCPSYRGSKAKSVYNAAAFFPHIEKAIERAKAIDTETHQAWPKNQATRVYLLAEKLLKGHGAVH